MGDIWESREFPSVSHRFLYEFRSGLMSLGDGRFRTDKTEGRMALFHIYDLYIQRVVCY